MLLFCLYVLSVTSLGRGVEPLNACGPDKFPCNDGSCVEKFQWCDTKLNCDDDSDELYCFKSSFVKNPNRCNETLFFVCDDGECIPAVGRCDGFSSCFDNSDEHNCDPAKNVLDGSANLTKPVNGESEESSVPLSDKDNKNFGISNTHENSMQSDMLHSDKASTNENLLTVSDANATEHFSSGRKLQQTDQYTNLHASSDVHKVLETKNNGSEVSPAVIPMNRHKPLEFRDLLSTLHSRNEPNAASHLEAENLQTSPDGQNPKTVALEKPKNQSNMSHPFNIQRDSIHAEKEDHKVQDLYKGYIKMRSTSYLNAKEKALQWLVHSRDLDFGWGEETARGMIALRMADYIPGKSSDFQLMTKQLHLKLFTALIRNETKTIPLADLALYINALSATCGNPRNFHGYDLVNILRDRVNAAHEASSFVTPFVYLVLCLHNATLYNDVTKLSRMQSDWNITKIDNEAMVSLAATCISRTQKFSDVEIGHIAARRLHNQITRNGLPANIYELSLVTQALNEARINQDLWNRTGAMRRITEWQTKDGSFGDILSTYYAVPTLSGRSFLWIGKVCPGKPGLDPLEVLKNSKEEKLYYVHYSLLFGNPLEMQQTLMLKIHKNTNFMDIMRIASTINPSYKFKYDMNEGKAIVYSIGGIANDAERGLYWTPYVSQNSTKGLVPYEGDIQSFIPADSETVAFWRKPIFKNVDFNYLLK